MWIKLAHLGYRLGLFLFPGAFLRSWGAEMQATFSDCLEDAVRNGTLPAAQFLIREGLALPGAAARMHLATLRAVGAKSPPGTTDWNYPARASELFLTAGVIGMPAAGIALRLPLESTLLCLALLAAGVILLGIRRSLGRWALPVFGVALSAFNFGLVYHWVARWMTPALLEHLGLAAQEEGARLLLHAFGSGLLWCCLFAFCALAYWLLSRVQRFAAFFSDLCRDWTQVSYLLYCGALFSFLLARGQSLFYGQDQGGNLSLAAPMPALMVTMSLVTGAWLFLRSPRQWQRMSSLVIGLTLATMGVFSGELALGPPLARLWLSLLEHQQVLPALNAAQWQVLQRSLLDWAWLVVFVCTPALLRWRPVSSRSALSSG